MKCLLIIVPLMVWLVDPSTSEQHDTDHQSNQDHDVEAVAWEPFDRDEQSVVHRLKNHLLKDYDKHVRPVRNVSHVTEMYVSMGVLALLKVDETESKIRAFVSTELYWVDEYLQWAPEEFDGLQLITLPLHLVWTPDLMCDQTIEVKRPLTADRELVRVTFNGAITFLNMEVHEFACVMESAKFPFDNQTCPLTYGSYGYDMKEVKWASDANTYHNPNAHPEWFITNFSAHHDDHTAFSQMQMLLQIKRKPSFYVITLMYPSSLITFLSILGMFTPGEASLTRVEKINVAMSTLLTLSVLLIVVADIIPKTESKYPQIGIFFFAQIGSIVLHTVVAIMIMYINTLAQWRVTFPTWLTMFSRHMRPHEPAEKATDVDKEDVLLTKLCSVSESSQPNHIFDNHTSNSTVRIMENNLAETTLTPAYVNSVKLHKKYSNSNNTNNIPTTTTATSNNNTNNINNNSQNNKNNNNSETELLLRMLQDLRLAVTDWIKQVDANADQECDEETNQIKWNRFCFVLDSLFLVLFLAVQMSLTVSYCSTNGQIILVPIGVAMGWIIFFCSSFDEILPQILLMITSVMIVFFFFMLL